MKKALLFCTLVLLASAAQATPANTPILDGRPIDYDSGDLRATFGVAPSWATVTVSNLFVTWDATHLYIGYQAWLQSDKLVVIIDADPDAGTGATTTTNWTGASYLEFNEFGWVDDSGAFGLDYMLASEGNYNNILRVLYDGAGPADTNNTIALFDIGNKNTPTGGTLDMACERNTSLCPHQGLEAKIPWSVFYGAEGRFGTIEAGETVPRGATIRLLAGVHNNTANDVYSAPDTLPRQTGAAWAAGLLTNPEYVDVVIDADNDGAPDLIGADVNAPWIRAASGAVGGTNLYVAFSEPVTAGTVESTGNWTIGGVAPSTATAQSPQVVLLGLADPIASTDLLLIRAEGVQDADLNSRPVEHCLFPAASGIPLPVTVTFQVNTNSGMGVSATHAKPNAFFVNGSSLPLEWGYSGYPPFESSPLESIPGSNGWASRSVTFLAGSPSVLYYKYSARISGTNTYEAITLTDYDKTSRPLQLNTNGAPQTVVDYLGAAAYPLRNTADTNLPPVRNRLYTDPQRGDAGVRVRREILFQLDLSLRRRDNLARVFVAGSDPLRGFNTTGLSSADASDYPGTYVVWTDAGVQLFDDGTHGDTAADDGIYARLWSFSTDGFDAAMEPGAPYSLVGGRASVYFPEIILGTEPYRGNNWSTRRSPRSVLYKFYAVTLSGNATNSFESPSSNLEYYVADPDSTDPIILDPFPWNDPYLPLPPPSNAPSLAGVTVAVATATVQFDNVLTEGTHGVKISTNLVDGFDDYGLRAVGGVTNAGRRQWSATVGEISPVAEFYAPYAGPEPARTATRWDPDLLTNAATTAQLYFCQFQTGLRGKRSLGVTGIADWSSEQPMAFVGDGIWTAEIALPEVLRGTLLECNFKQGATWANVPNAYVIRGDPCTWTPTTPVPGELFTITLDSSAPGAYFKNGGPLLSSATNFHVHLGYDGWSEASARPMTNTSGSLWEYAVTVPAPYTNRVDWVFKGFVGGTTNWYPAFDRQASMQSETNNP